MVKFLLNTYIYIFIISAYPQDSTAYFSTALRSKMKNYTLLSDKAYEDRNLIEGKRLFDSLVRYDLVGTKFDDFTVRSYNAKKVELNKITTPLYIITYASWCIINKGDASALNKLARENASKIKVMVLFWDQKKDIKKLARQFSKDILICYAHERYANDENLVNRLKHTLGLPNTFFIDSDKSIIDIERITNYYDPKISMNEAVEKSYTFFNTAVNKFLRSKLETEKVTQ